MRTHSKDITVPTSLWLPQNPSLWEKTHLKTINNQGILIVRSITSDASAQIMKAVHDYEKESNIPTRHYKCFIHKLRSFQKYFRGIKLTSSLIGCNKDIFMRKLSSNIRSRLRVELIRIKKTTTEDSFLYRASNAVQNIISCFANDNRNCRKYSLVCNAHLQRYSTKHLPYGKHLELNMNNIVKLNGIIEKHFSETELSKISRLSTTNKCESLHHKVFTFAPKSTIYTRNFAGLCHSAVHSSSLGNGLTCINLAKIIGLKYKRRDPFIQRMKKIDTNNRRNAIRMQIRRYKSSRYIARRNKGNRTLKQNSLFNCTNKSIIEEHEYASSKDFTC
jgi:hypothetical protein